MFAKMYLKNPDENKIYHVWHFCKVCGQTWNHSQSSWNSLKRYKCCNDNLESVATDISFQPVTIIESDEFGYILSKVS